MLPLVEMSIELVVSVAFDEEKMRRSLVANANLPFLYTNRHANVN